MDDFLMKNGYKIVFVIFLILSIAGITFVADTLIKESKMETVYAICERREFSWRRTYRGLTTDYYYCYMNYDYGGNNYSTVVESAITEVGGKLKIKVDPQNPAIYRVASNYFYLFIIVCVPIIITITIGMCGLNERKKNSIKREE